MRVNVEPVALSFDADVTTFDEVLSSLDALISYAIEAKLGYEELESIELERG